MMIFLVAAAKYFADKGHPLANDPFMIFLGPIGSKISEGTETMKTAIERILILLVVTSLAGCGLVDYSVQSKGVQGSGVTKTESREVKDFDSISLEGHGNLDITVGNTDSLLITTDDNLLPLIETFVEDGVLKIRPTEAINTKADITLDLSTAALKKLQIMGSSTVNIDLSAGETLAIEIDGAGSVNGVGTVNELDIEINGAGSVNLEKLQSKSAKLEISGAGRASVFASQSIEVELNGVGSVTIYGDPTNIKKEVNGIGTIKKANE